MKSTSGSRPVVVHRGSRREHVGRDGRGVLTHTRRFVAGAVFGSIFTSDSVQVASISPSSNCDRLLDSNLGGATVMSLSEGGVCQVDEIDGSGGDDARWRQRFSRLELNCRAVSLRFSSSLRPLSSSPGSLPPRGPHQIRTRRFPPSGSSADASHGHRPQICTAIRGRGRGNRLSKAANPSHVRPRWLRRCSHLDQDRSVARTSNSRLCELPFTPK